MSKVETNTISLMLASKSAASTASLDRHTSLIPCLPEGDLLLFRLFEVQICETGDE